MGIMLKNLKMKEKGAISTVVLFTIFIFIVILMGVYVSIAINEKSQLQSDMKIQEIYGRDLSKIDKVYVETAESAWNQGKNVNKPALLTGMTPIKFNMPTQTSMGSAAETTESDEDWYGYGISRKWANAETEDGSMWVWIPRYAYKIDETNKTVKVKFLIGTTDFYIDDDGGISQAQRVTSKSQTVVTNGEAYTVHPAFTDERAIDFANGGWKEELTGIWVAKFEAGYAGGNNSIKQVNSTVSYSNPTTNFYGECTTDTKIKYPVFRPLTYSVNNISIQDSYKISKALTGANNIYGLNSSNADSHLMKNSEWGAVAYLTQSSHEKNSEITINNVNLNNSLENVYAVTGCTSNSADENEVNTLISSINGVSGNEADSNTNRIYVWNQLNGQNASTTGNIYGIYDMNGGVWERTAAFISNGDENLEAYGEELKTVAGATTSGTGTSNEYITIYANTYANNHIIGDAVKETSTSGTGNTSWGEKYSYYPEGNQPTMNKGGMYGAGSNGGIFAFYRTNGGIYRTDGFRAVLVKK